MTYTMEFVQVVHNVCIFVPGRHKARETITDAYLDQVHKHDRQRSAKTLEVTTALTILVVAEGIEQRKHAADFEVPYLGQRERIVCEAHVVLSGEHRVLLGCLSGL